MTSKTIYELKAIHRDNMRINCRTFGSGEKSAAIVGGIRGNEIQQIFCCALLVKKLDDLEKAGKIVKGKSIMVVPVINPYSVNIEKRFWPTDNTDINRMFPGYDLGETTQRAAAGLFGEVSQYAYGIQFASNYIPGKFVPHIRLMDTGWDYTDEAMNFGLQYIVRRKPRPYDTTTLNYNWQIWNTKSFSLFTNQTDTIDIEGANEAVRAVLNFLSSRGIIEFVSHRGYISSIIDEGEMLSVKSKAPGIFLSLVDAGDKVRRNQTIAQILDPYTCSVLEEIQSPSDGTVFFTQTKSLAYANAVLFKLIPTL